MWDVGADGPIDPDFTNVDREELPGGGGSDVERMSDPADIRVVDATAAADNAGIFGLLLDLEEERPLPVTNELTPGDRPGVTVVREVDFRAVSLLTKCLSDPLPCPEDPIVDPVPLLEVAMWW
mmetsp:Transcript_1148/g.1770  ORF Transcript_1148/g.1770 Transcript_1148/m.1770 type:complete len:123 (+) Transcript_1148:386-754(+)